MIVSQLYHFSGAFACSQFFGGVALKPTFALQKSRQHICPRYPVIPPEIWCLRYIFGFEQVPNLVALEGCRAINPGGSDFGNCQGSVESLCGL